MLAIVTGATGAMGKVIATRIAETGQEVVLACRSKEKAERALREITEQTKNGNISALHLDCASLQSVRDFANHIIERKQPVSLIVNNAGILAHERTISKDGYEMDLATNYLAPYLLCRLLIPALDEKARIVNVVSCTTKIGKVTKDIFDTDHFSRFGSYSNSKLALLLFTTDLAERLKATGICVNAADPGIVDTNMISMGKWFDPLADLLFRPIIRTPEQGAATALHLALNTEVGTTSGQLFASCKQQKISDKIRNHPLKEWLWEETAKRVGLNPTL